MPEGSVKEENPPSIATLNAFIFVTEASKIFREFIPGENGPLAEAEEILAKPLRSDSVFVE